MKAGGYRAFLNLKNLNHYFSNHHCKMESLRDIKGFVCRFNHFILNNETKSYLWGEPYKNTVEPRLTTTLLVRPYSFKPNVTTIESFYYFEDPVNATTSLLRPGFYGPTVVALTEFHCMSSPQRIAFIVLATIWSSRYVCLHAGKFFGLHRFKCGLTFPSLLSILTVNQTCFISDILLNSFP